MMIGNAELTKPTEKIDTKGRIFTAVKDFLNGTKAKKTGQKVKMYPRNHKTHFCGH